MKSSKSKNSEKLVKGDISNMELMESTLVLTLDVSSHS